MMTLMEEINKNAVVQSMDLRCPEYGFQMCYDFALRKIKCNPRQQDEEAERKAKMYHKQIEMLCIIITALLNTSGGFFKLQSWDVIAGNLSEVSMRTLDEWLSNICQQLVVLPRWIFSEAVRLTIRGSAIHGYVKKSPHLITRCSHLFVRSSEANSMICDDVNHLRIIMTKKATNPPVHSSYSGLQIGDIVGPEGLHLDHKDWNITDAAGVMKRLKVDPKSLLAFGNVDGGGDLVIGIQEEKVSEQNLVRGCSLSRVEMIILRDELQTWLSDQMIFGQSSVKPKPNVHYFINFIPVTGGPPGDDKDLIVIHMEHVEGGLFEKTPECYTMTDDGEVELMNFEDWKEKILSISQSAEVLEYGPHKREPLLISSDNESDCEMNAGSSSLPPKKKPRTGSESDLNQTKSSVGNSTQSDGFKSLAKLQKKPSLASLLQKTDKTEKLISEVSWVSGGIWKNFLTDSNILEDLQCIEKRLNLTDTYPLHFTPSRENLVQMCLKNSLSGSVTEMEIVNAISFIENQNDNQAGFALAFLSWDKIFDHTAHMVVPNGHVFDVLVSTPGSLELISMFSSKGLEHRLTQTLFTHQLCRTLKKHLLMKLDKHAQESVKNIKITPKIYYLQNQELYPCSDRYDFLTIDIANAGAQMEGVQRSALFHALMSLLVDRCTEVRQRIDQLSSFKLTEQQVHCSLQCLDSRFNLIDGAPGAGKSVMVSYLCDRWNKKGQKHKILCLCPRKPFACYLEYQGKADVLHVDNDARMKEAVQKITDNKYAAVITDDSQSIKCRLASWISLYKAVYNSQCKKIGTKLFIMMDSRFQTFGTAKHAQAVRDTFEKFCKDRGLSPSVISLRKVLRNHRCVFTYMKANILQNHCPEGNELISYHTNDGDDVRMTVVINLWVDSPENGLLEHVLQMIYPADNLTAYHPHDILVLTDDEDDAAFLICICRKHWPEPLKSTVQDGTVFPVKGVTIETVNNIIGLEARACVYVGKRYLSQTQTYQDWKYRMFVASRGIDRVDFLSPSSFEASVAEDMGYTAIDRQITSEPSFVVEVANDYVRTLWLRPTITFGSKGHGRGQFTNVVSVAALSSGDIVAADLNTKLLQLFNSSGEHISSFKIGDAIHDVCASPDGSIVAASRSKVHKIDIEGKLIWQIICNKIIRDHDQDSKLIPLKNMINPPEICGVACEQNGDIYVRMQRYICVLNSAGSIVAYLEDKHVPEDSSYKCPGIAVSPKGNIFLPVPDRDCVVMLSKSGRYLNTIRGTSSVDHLMRPVDVAVGQNGIVAVCSLADNSVYVYEEDGTFLYKRGSLEYGMFDQPWGVDISPTGKLLVADMGNHRIIVF